MAISFVGNPNIVFEYKNELFIISELFVPADVVWGKCTLSLSEYASYWKTSCHTQMNSVPAGYVKIIASNINSNLFMMAVEYAGLQTKVHFFLQDINYAPINHKRAVAVRISK